MTRKNKLDSIEAAVSERRLALDFLADRKKQLAIAKKQFDQAVEAEAAAEERLAKAERAMEKTLDEAK